MRTRKTSSGDRTAERCKYLFNVPKQERITARIERLKPLANGVFKIVRLFDHDGKLIYEQIL